MLCPVCHVENSITAIVCSACGMALSNGSIRLKHATSDSTLPLGATLQNGQYSLAGVLGQGGFGITYRGHDSGLNRAVAIKEFFPSGCTRDSMTVLPADSSVYQA